MFVVAESGVFFVLAATRYRLQYDAWHKYEPPRIARFVPSAGPTGFTLVPNRW